MLAPLVVGIAALTATDQLIIAIAAVLLTVNTLLPVVVTVWSHWIQQQSVRENGAKLDTINSNTNGALHGVQKELAEVKRELAAWKATQPGYLPPRVD